MKCRSRYASVASPLSILARWIFPLILFSATCQAAPTNDGFAAAALLTGLPLSTSGTNTEATLQTGEPDPSGGDGTASVWWSWTAPASGWVEINTFTSTFDTILAVYTGSGLTGLTLIAWNDQAAGSDQSRLKINAVSGTVYRLQVMGWQGAAGSVRLALKSTIPPNPPSLQRLTLAPLSVDVTTADVTLSVEIQFSAPRTLDSVDLGFLLPSGAEFYAFVTGLVPVSGTLEGGIYRGQIIIPRGKAGGSWNVAAFLYDSENDFTGYGTAGSPPLPPGSTTAVTLINNAAGDTQPPVIHGAAFTPDPVDVSAGSGSVLVRVTASDDVAVSSIGVGFSATGPGFVAFLSLTAADLASGTLRSGVWEKTLVVPGFAPPGPWTITYNITDAAGRVTTYAASGAPLPPALPGVLTLKNTGLVDAGGPVLESITMDQGSVDITGAAGSVRLAATLSDAPSGLRSATVRLVSPSGDLVADAVLFTRSTSPFPTIPVTTAVDLTVPRYLAPGLYRWELAAYDEAYRASFYGGTGTGFPGGFPGTLTVQNRGPVDVAGPELQRLTVTPSSLGTASLPAVIQLTADVTDDAGIQSAIVLLERPGGAAPRALGLVRTAGTAIAGRWTSGFTLPYDSPAGSYALGVVLTDVAGREVRYGNMPDATQPLPGDSPEEIAILTSPVAGAYAMWRAARPLLSGPAGLPGADYDADGLPNVMEFLLGTDPLVNSTPGGLDPDASRAPVYFLTTTHLRVEYRLSAANAALGSGTSFVLLVQSSSTPATAWGPALTIPLEGDLWRAEVPLGTAGAAFLRFSVVP